jgi:hypothetical protein
MLQKWRGEIAKFRCQMDVSLRENPELHRANWKRA